MFQVFAMVISALTVTMTSIEVYFLDRDMMEKKSWQEIFRRNILVTPYFMTNTIFKILSMGLIFALFKTWGLLILILWSVCYTFIIAQLHSGPLPIAKNLIGKGPTNAFIIYPGTLLPSIQESQPMGRKNPHLHTPLHSPLPRYKAIMKMGIWANFGYNTIWLLYGIALKANKVDEPKVGPPRNIGTNIDCFKSDDLNLITIIIWSIGLLSCVIVQIYLTKFPHLLGLNKEDDYCTNLIVSAQETQSGENKDVANEALEVFDTCLNQSECLS